MTETRNSILSRKLRAASGGGAKGALPPELTPSRALRTALSRAAADALNLPVTVLGIVIEPMPLDDLLGQIGEEMGLLWLLDQDEPVGIVAADADTRAALIEMQTIGRVLPVPADKARRVTRTDTALLVPLVSRFLENLPEACEGSVLQGWSDHATLGGHLDNTRSAGLVLTDTTYRLVRMTLDFGETERQGEILIALPLHRAGPKDAQVPDAAPDWADTFRSAVFKAPASMHAVLPRQALPLKTLERFAVGDILPLPGVTVSSVRLEGPGNKLLAQARLGQMAGLRAVRIEAAAPATMSEAGIGSGPAMPSFGLSTTAEVDAVNELPAPEDLPNLPEPDLTDQGEDGAMAMGDFDLSDADMDAEGGLPDLAAPMAAPLSL